jgi:hypothetical protein
VGDDYELLRSMGPEMKAACQRARNAIALEMYLGTELYRALLRGEVTREELGLASGENQHGGGHEAPPLAS